MCMCEGGWVWVYMIVWRWVWVCMCEGGWVWVYSVKVDGCGCACVKVGGCGCTV